MTTMLDTMIDDEGRPERNFHPLLGRGVSLPVDHLQAESEIEEQEIIGARKDDRFEVPNARKRKPPFRWICSLKVYFRDPDNPGKVLIFDKGTGSLVGERHVLTAAHVIYSEVTGSRGTKRKQKALRIKVYPGRDRRSMLFGSSESSSLAYPSAFRPSLDARFDYGLIKLKKALGSKTFRKIGGARLGWWGTNNTFVKALKRSYLQGKVVNVAGYPDTKSHEQWMAFDTVHDATPTAGGRALPQVITYRTDTSDGQSGAPVWRYVKSSKKRFLVAVHRGGCHPNMGGCKVSGKTTSNMGVLITGDVIRQIERWKNTM